MPILDPTQKPVVLDLIHQAQDAGGATPEAIADWLDEPQRLPNPEPQPQVPAPFAAADAAAILGPADLARIMALPAFDGTILPLLNADPKSAANILALNQWAGILFKSGLFTQAAYDALAAPAPGTTPNAPIGLFNRTVADPSWPAEVMGPSRWQRAFPGVTFALPTGVRLIDQCSPEIIAEALS
jgi:hypothetical protein